MADAGSTRATRTSRPATRHPWRDMASTLAADVGRIGIDPRPCFAEDVRVQLLERALVTHEPQRHPAGDAYAELVRVEPADRGHAARLAEAVPLAQVGGRRATDRALRRPDHAREVADATDALAGVVEERPELDAVQAVGVAELDAPSPEAFRAARERVRAEPK